MSLEFHDFTYSHLLSETRIACIIDPAFRIGSLALIGCSFCSSEDNPLESRKNFLTVIFSILISPDSNFCIQRTSRPEANVNSFCVTPNSQRTFFNSSIESSPFLSIYCANIRALSIQPRNTPSLDSMRSFIVFSTSSSKKTVSILFSS